MPHSRHHSQASSASSSSSSSVSEITTNTIAITNLPRTFFTRSILDILRSHFESHGEINQWVPLAGFGRIICVYERDDSAEQARNSLGVDALIPADSDGNQIPLRVYRADRNPVLPSSGIPNEFYLAPPPQEKNFLISPPGSPPVGWEPVVEEPPNATPLAEDLMTALKKLQLDQQRPNDGEGGLEILLHPDEAGVGVYVEDCCDPEGDQEWQEKKAPWAQPMATAMPPRAAMPPMPRAVAV